MKFKKVLLATILACSGWGVAQAQQVWAWSYSGTGVTASGTLTTAGNALSFEDVLAVSGTRNGEAITGLVPVGDDPDFLYDNQFTATAPHFTDGGLLFSFGGGLPNINLYYFGGEYVDLYIDGLTPIETAVSFSVTAVPEPATALAMLAGLGLVGAQLRRRRVTV
jgi:PEP-CTERM motif